MKPFYKSKNLLFYTLYTVLTSIALTRGIFLLFLTHKGLSVSEVALYSIVLNISITIFEIPTGYFGDKFGKHNSLMLGCFLLALHSFTMIISKKPVAFMILAGLEGFAYTFVTGSNSALLYDILKREHTENDYLKINSKVLSLESLTIGISIFIGGELAAYSWNLVYGIQIITMLFAIVFLKNIDEPEHNSKTVHLKTDFKKYRPGTILCFFILISSITDGIFCGYYNMNQLFLDRIHITVATIGLFFSASYFINSAAYLLVGFILKILNRKQIFIYGLFIQGFLFLLLMRMKNPSVFLIFTIIACFIPEILFAVSDSIIQDYIDSKYRATILSVVSMLRTCTTALCYGIMGKVFDQISLGFFFLGLAVITLIFAGLSTIACFILNDSIFHSDKEC